MTPVLTVEPVAIDRARRVVCLHDLRLPVTAFEFAVLEALVQACGAVVSRDRLSQAVLGRPWQHGNRGLDQLVFQLRRKLPPDEHGGPFIQTIRNAGYWMRAASTEGAGMSVVDEIAAERRRQIEQEGWSLEHDDTHRDRSICAAAASYAANAGSSDALRAIYGAGHPPPQWAWGNAAWKPQDRRHDLIRAAALLVAEIERLDRLPDAAQAAGTEA